MLCLAQPHFVQSNLESCTAIINSKQNWYFDSHLVWPQIHENNGLLQDHMKVT